MKNKTKFRPLYVAALYALASIFFLAEAFGGEHLKYNFSFVGYGGTFKHTNLKLFGISLYFVTIIIGLALCITLSIFRRKKTGMSVTVAVLFPIGVLAVALIGGKLLYIIEKLDTVSKKGIGVDGFSLFGSIFLSVLACFIIGCFKKKRVAYLLDNTIFYELILLAAVRTGCFLNGCCGADAVWVDGKPIIIPIQLFEVFFDLVIFDICLKVKASKGADGRMYPVFLIGYSIVRFFLEFWRNNPKTLLFLTNGQIFSLVGIALGIILYRYFANKLFKNYKR